MSRSSLRGVFALLAVGALCWPAASPAQSGGIVPRVEDGKRIYSVDQFVRFAPLNAADMVAQIPGFSVSNVSVERGLGEASQNVLINGQRITGKNNDAMTMLRRIPIGSVLWLEVLDGATLDIGGLAGQVVNVIADSQGIEGNFAWRPQFRERIKDHWPAGEVNLSGKTTLGDFSAGFRWDGFHGGGWGEEVEYRPGTDVTVVRSRQPRFGFDAPKISGSFSRSSEAGSLWNINASVDRARDLRDSITRYQEPGEGITTDDSRGRTRKWRSEVGTDYEFALGGGKLKLVAFYAQRKGPNDDTFISTEDGDPTPSGARFLQDSNEGERVLRSEYRFRDWGADWTLSAEGAHNFVDVTGALEVLGSDGQFEPVPLAGASSRVEELRGESILGASRPLGGDLSVQVSGGVEFSRLKQDGEAGQTRRFWRPKGSVSLAWNPNTRWEMNLKLQRKVGQLNFYDFLASVDVDNNNANGSNGALVPPQSWLMELETVRNLGAAGKLRLNLTREDIEDRVEQIPISATAEAPGNVPKARKLEAALDISLLLDGIGLRGARFDSNLAQRDTRLRDPLDGEHRRLNGNRAYWNVEFRHDVPGTPWAWGFFAERQSPNRSYRLDYTNKFWSSRPNTMVFIEEKAIWGLKIRGEVSNLLNSRDRSRAVSYVERRDGPVDYIRSSTITYGRIYRLRVSGTF
jgi:outer membrane receptor for ferrienterochelin and colicins